MNVLDFIFDHEIRKIRVIKFRFKVKLIKYKEIPWRPQVRMKNTRDGAR